MCQFCHENVMAIVPFFWHAVSWFSVFRDIKENRDGTAYVTTPNSRFSPKASKRIELEKAESADFQNLCSSPE